jgi:hypothetical protein
MSMMVSRWSPKAGLIGTVKGVESRKRPAKETSSTTISGFSPDFGCRLSLFTTVGVLILKDFHGWEPSEFCFIDDSFSVIMAAREPHFLC